MAEIMKRIEGVLFDTRPDLVPVYGDVSSTVAAGLLARIANVLVPMPAPATWNRG